MSDLAAAERAAQSGLDRELPPLRYDARTTVSPTQRRILLLFAAGVVVAIPLLGPGTFVRVAVAGVTVLYLTDLVFNAWVITGSLRQVRSRSVVVRSDRREPALWPSYTVLCPMYKEVAVLPQFVAAMTALDYPADRLEVLLLLEEDDTETVEAVRAMVLPDSFQIVIVPDSLPRTKPKACNHGLLLASGEHCVIFDTEDVPEPDQLKKAALAFRDAPHRIACLQAPLNFYNPRQNVLTRLFTAEYSLWFDLMLVGLQRLNGPIPLGGLPTISARTCCVASAGGIRTTSRRIAISESGCTGRVSGPRCWTRPRTRKPTPASRTGSGSVRDGSRDTCRRSWFTRGGSGVVEVGSILTF